MSVRKVDGVTVDADTLDGDQLATIEATMDTKVSAHDEDAGAHPGLILTFTELAGGENKLVDSADTWQDWDISAIVPVGTKLVYVCALNSSTASAWGSGVRVKGSALERFFGMALTSQFAWKAGVDANRYIQIKAGSTTEVRFDILGYWS